MDRAEQHLQTNHSQGGPGVSCLCVCGGPAAEGLMNMSLIRIKVD